MSDSHKRPAAVHCRANKNNPRKGGEFLAGACAGSSGVFQGPVKNPVQKQFQWWEIVSHTRRLLSGTDCEITFRRGHWGSSPICCCNRSKLCYKHEGRTQHNTDTTRFVISSWKPSSQCRCTAKNGLRLQAKVCPWQTSPLLSPTLSSLLWSWPELHGRAG